MFGQQNDKKADDNQIPDHSIEGAMHDNQAPAPPTPPNPPAWGHPGTPLDANDHPQPEEPSGPPPEVITPDSAKKPDSPSHADSFHTPGNPAPSNDAAANSLIDIKQQALSQLSPLVQHLDQAPEDKFRTTMMMIQASDDQTLVQIAYEAAQQIPDEKVRAQALLDIVNEINYFTQHHQN